MTLAINFSDISSIEALLRGTVLFKFDCPQAEMYVGSPQHSEAASLLLQAVIDEYRRSGKEEVAKRWEKHYLLSNHPERREFVGQYARRHPKWASMDTQQRKAWIDTVAAPYRISDEDYQSIMSDT
ncbi:hypothetical protein [Streptomyces sp. 6N223]|uniref:hypothetical protein n=1 Tax=Streptomyces sp. 6N223 TaxID=3457412 RepID=UPI003FD61E5D